MRSIFAYIFRSFVPVLGLTALLLCSCERVEDPLRPLSPVPLSRTCLLLEFTGVRCNNCPRAAEEAHRLLQVCSDRLIVVEMHPPTNPFTDVPAYDYRCAEADVWYRRFGGSATTPFPAGVINLQPGFLDFSAWQSELVAEYRDTLTYRSYIPSDTVLWVVEDSILGAQVMPGGDVRTDYYHNHVLRGRIDCLSDTTAIRPMGSGDHRYVVAVVLDALDRYVDAYIIPINH